MRAALPCGLFLAALLLIGCGVDGPPVPPGAAEPTRGITLSGEARMGVVFAP